MRLFGLIGYPLSHSFSPEYFAQKFMRENINDVKYKPFPLENISELISLIASQPELCGLNVTIPYKQSVLQYLDETDITAIEANAVNCITIKRANNKTILKGYNTDVWGFQKSLKTYLKKEHKAALILGTGGASNAVAVVLKKLNIEHVFVSRNISANNLIYSGITEEITEKHTLIINTTPLGMYPAVEGCPPIPYEYINSNHLLFDLIYNPTETLFMKKGLAKGATVVNGLEMLHYQAEKSWDIWNK